MRELSRKFLMVILLFMFVLPLANVLGHGKISTAAGASGRTYYVSTTGNDSNSGTATNPFRTVARGVSQLQPGDTLYLNSGKYIQYQPLTISRSGTSTAPITISTAPGQRTQAIITGDTDGDNMPDVPDLFSMAKLISISGDYVVLQNVEVTYSGGRGVSPEGNHDVVKECNIHHMWGDGLHVFGSYAVISDNIVWRNDDSNYCNLTPSRKCNGNWGGGISIGDPNAPHPPGANNTIIEGNTVFNNSGEGILCMHTGGSAADDGILVKNNTVYDNWAAGIDLDKCSNSTVRNNLIYYSKDTGWWKNGDITRPGSGILISNEQTSADRQTRRGPGDTYPIGHDRKIVNNIVAGAGANIFFWLGDGPTDTGANFIASALQNDLIANNTFVEAQGNGESGIKINATYPGYSHENTLIANNIFQQTSGVVANVGSNGIGGITFSNNLWSRTPPGNVMGSGDYIGNPGMVDSQHPRDAGAVRTDWYKLAPGSRAIGRGKHISQVVTDFFGASRKSTPDIGAHEYGGKAGGTITPEVTLTPEDTAVPTITSTALPPGLEVITLPVMEDAYVSEENPDQNYGQTEILKSDGGILFKSYLKFDLSQLSGRNITRAVFKIKTTIQPGAESTAPQTLRPLANPDDEWSESTITSNHRPAQGPSATSLTPEALDTWYTADVTSLVEARSGLNLSFVVGTTDTNGAEYYAKESGQGAVLEVTVIAPLTISLVPAGDTTVKASSPNVNFGKEKSLQADRSAEDKKIYIKFDTSPLAGKTITHAELKVRTTDNDYSGSDACISLKGLAQPDQQWSETKITYNSRPALADSAFGCFDLPEANTWYSLDVTQIVQQHAGEVLTLGMETMDSDGIELGSRESENDPVLTVTYFE